MAPTDAADALNDLPHALRNAVVLLTSTAICAVVLERFARWATRRARTRAAQKHAADQAAALHKTRQAQR